MRLKKRRILGARPDCGSPLGSATARRGIEHLRGQAAIEQHLSGRHARRVYGRLRGRSHDLTVGLIAQIETVSTMASEICEGKRANGDRKRLESSGTALPCRLAREDTGDVC